MHVSWERVPNDCVFLTWKNLPNKCFKSPLETQLNISASEVILLCVFFINILFCSHEFIKWERFLYVFPCLIAFISCPSFNVLSTLWRGKFSWASLRLTIEELGNSTGLLSLVPPNTTFRNISVHGTLATTHGILPQHGLLLYYEEAKSSWKKCHHVFLGEIQLFSPKKFQFTSINST